MYKCLDCYKLFDDPNEIETTYESYYGVSGDFSYNTPMTISVCPYCNSESIEEIEDEEEENECE